MPEKDSVEKTLEWFDDVFADIINVVVFGGKRIIKPNDLSEATPYSMYKADQKLHGQSRDVAKYWLSGAFQLASIGLENQTAYNADEPLLVIAYDGASYKNQVDADNKEGPRHRFPVITLVLSFSSHHWNASRTLMESLDFPDWEKIGGDEVKADFMRFFTDYKANIIEVSFFTEEQIKLFQSDFRVVADFFVHRRKNPNYRPSPWKLSHVEATMQLLSVMTGDQRYEEVLNEEWEGGRPNQLDPYLDRLINNGRNEGRTEGEIIGAVGAYRDVGLSEDIVRDKIKVKYHLTQEQAEKYVPKPVQD